MKVQEIAEKIGGRVVGEGQREVTGVAEPDDADEREELSFVEDAKFTEQAEERCRGVDRCGI